MPADPFNNDFKMDEEIERNPMNKKMIAKELLKIAKSLAAGKSDPQTPNDWMMYGLEGDGKLEKKYKESDRDKAALELHKALQTTKEAMAKAVETAFKEKMKPVLKKYSDLGVSDVDIAQDYLKKYMRSEMAMDIDWNGY